MKKLLLFLFVVFVNLGFAQTSDEYFRSGNAKIQSDDYKGAIQDLNKAIELNSKNADAYNLRGEAKRDLGDYRGAIQDYTKAIELYELYPKDINHNYNLSITYGFRGQTKQELGDYRGAIQDYNKVIKLNPKDGVAYYNRGLAKIDLGNKEAGCLDLSKAGELGEEKAYETIKEYCK